MPPGSRPGIASRWPGRGRAGRAGAFLRRQDLALVLPLGGQGGGVLVEQGVPPPPCSLPGIASGWPGWGHAGRTGAVVGLSRVLGEQVAAPGAKAQFSWAQTALDTMASRARCPTLPVGASAKAAHASYSVTSSSSSSAILVTWGLGGSRSGRQGEQ